MEQHRLWMALIQGRVGTTGGMVLSSATLSAPALSGNPGLPRSEPSPSGCSDIAGSRPVRPLYHFLAKPGLTPGLGTLLPPPGRELETRLPADPCSPPATSLKDVVVICPEFLEPWCGKVCLLCQECGKAVHRECSEPPGYECQGCLWVGIRAPLV